MKRPREDGEDEDIETQQPPSNRAATDGTQVLSSPNSTVERMVSPTPDALNTSASNNNNELSLSPRSPQSPPERMDVDGSSPGIDLGPSASPDNGASISGATDNVTELVMMMCEEIRQMYDEEGDSYWDNEEAKPHATLEFRIHNVSKIKDEQILSPPTYVRSLPWRILAMPRNPKGVADLRSSRSLGFFLQCNALSESTTWSCGAKAELRLVAHREGCEDIVRRIWHCFYSKENDWGFATFVSWADLLNPEKGFIHDDSILLRVHVQADAPHGVSWDSKRHTGFVGLKNQGATCYMNSLLQTLYFTHELRRAVYLMPTESDDAQSSVPLALQRVFYELQHSEQAVGTKKLTRSFGWESFESFLQHDVQEMCRVLMDNMETKMKGTSVEDCIPRLFRGKMLSYIKCKHVDYKSERVEKFYDIQLKVKGNATIYDAFKEYVSVETLEGDNKYDAGVYGLQEAEKGVVFLKFPPVLYLQLMRFQYDVHHDKNVKINDRLEFPYTLYLDSFLAKPERTPAMYHLHAVLVHSGDISSGHYVVYINTHGDNRWYRFDDDVVSRCSRKEAITMNYGGNHEEVTNKHCTNAYMLVYIRESVKLSQVLAPVETSDLPVTLIERLEGEKRLEAQKRKEKAEAHLFTSVQLFLEEDFDGWQGFDLCEHDTLPKRMLRFKKTITQGQFHELVSRTLRQPLERIRPWTLCPSSRNGTLRLNFMNLTEHPDKPMPLEEQPHFYVWVQVLSLDSTLSALPPFHPDMDILLFLKYYNPRTATITYCGHVVVSLQKQMSVILDTLYERSGLDRRCRLLLFDEQRPATLMPIGELDKQVTSCFEHLVDGSIIVFQEDVSNLSLDLPTAIDYYKDLFYRLDVQFIDKTAPNDESKIFVLELSQKTTYDQLAKAVGHYLNTNPHKIQFFKAQGPYNTRELPGASIKSSFDGQLKDLFNIYSRPKVPARRLYYQRLEMRLDELENMRQFKCVFVNGCLRDEKELVINLPKTSKVADLLAEARKQIDSGAAGLTNGGGNGTLGRDDTGASLPRQRSSPSPPLSHDSADGGEDPATPVIQQQQVQQEQQQQQQQPASPPLSQQQPQPQLPSTPAKLRLLEVVSCKIVHHFEDDMQVSQLPVNSNRQLRIEEVPPDELRLRTDEMIVNVAHFHKESYATFGVPFTLKIKEGERFDDIKSRIQRRLDVPDKEFEKWRFAVVTNNRATYFPDGEGNGQVTREVFSTQTTGALATRPWLGLDHVNKHAKRPRYIMQEKAIKIHN